MNTKQILVLSLVVAIAAAIVGMVIANRNMERAVALERVSQPATTSAPKISGSTAPTEIPAVGTESQIQPAAKPQLVAAQTAPPANANGPLQDPTARIALSFVGADPNAEAYWIGAISDPNLSNQEREDLMEDLNEDGLSDPQHPGPEDLPLILNRIRLIEELAPYADNFMLEHLGEAHKDLVNMLNGKPVQ